MGSRFLGRRPCVTSCSRNSIRLGFWSACHPRRSNSDYPLRSNGSRSVIFRCIFCGLVGIIAFHERHYSLRVDRNMRRTNPVLWRHDKIRLSIRGQVSHGDVVETFERGCCINRQKSAPPHLRDHLPAVLSSMMILSAIWIISGLAPTLAPGMIPPSSVMADASMIATSNCQESENGH